MTTQEPRPGSAPGAGTTGPAGAPAGPPAAEFFDRIRSLGVVRPDEGRWAAGVCTGLARRWGLDPLLVRGLFIVGGILSGIGVGVYGLLWLFLPHPDGRIHAQQVLRGVVTAGFVGAAIALLIDFPLAHGSWFGGHSGWGFQPFGFLTFVGVIGLVAWWIAHPDRRRGGPPSGGPGSPTDATPPAAGHGPEPGAGTGYGTNATYGYAATGTTGAYGYGGGAATATAPALMAPRPVDVHRPLHSLTLATLGLAALAGSGVLVWDRAIHRVPGSAGVVSLATALGVIALGIVLAGSLGRRAGGLAPLAVLLAILSVAGAAGHDAVGSTRRDATWTPTTAVAGNGYNLGAGRAVLDLTSPALTTGATAANPVSIPVSVGVGELVVIVPATTPTEIDASVGLGNLTDEVGTRGDHGGAGLNETVTSGNGTPLITVQAKIGLGRISIVPQGTKVTG